MIPGRVDHFLGEAKLDTWDVLEGLNHPGDVQWYVLSGDVFAVGEMTQNPKKTGWTAKRSRTSK